MAEQFIGDYSSDDNTLELDKKVDRKARVLLPPGSKETEELELQILANEALAVIGRYLPEWTPQQQTSIAVWKTQAEAGAYVGKWNESHHLLITVSEQEIKNAEKRAALVLRIAHELLHQRVAEIVGTDDPNSIGIDRHMNNKMVKEMTDFKKAEAMFGAGSNASFLQKVINEGCAVYGELQILEAILVDIASDTNQTSVARELINRRKSELVEAQNDANSTYAVGFGLVEKLLKIYKHQSLNTLLSLVNWEECAKFQIGTSKYQEIIDNPQNIPGLEAHNAK